MKNITASIRNSLMKRQVALTIFLAKREAFLVAKAHITMDIEEARDIWIQTLERLTNQEFGISNPKVPSKQVNSNSRQAAGIKSPLKTITYKTISHHEQQQ
jgi:hypothetical protein